MNLEGRLQASLEISKIPIPKQGSAKSQAINEPAIERCRFKNASCCVGALYNFLTMEKIF